MSVDKGTPGCSCPIWFAGPLKGKKYCMLVDTHSKWPIVVTTEKIIQVMRGICSQPEQVVSDNGSQFRV